MWSHMYGSWYFSKLLLSEGSFTQINIAPLMFLVTPCDSMSTVVKLRAYWVPCKVAIVVIWGWPLRCSFSLSPKVLPDSPIYSSGQLMCGDLNPHMTTLFKVCCPSPWGHEEGFYGVCPLNECGSPNCCMSF